MDEPFTGIEKRIKSRMQKTTKKNAGLCATCARAATCTDPKASGRPVIFCEEFNGSRQNSVAEKPNLSAVAENVDVKPKAGKSTELKGLCINCEIRDTCTFPKAEGGIWHCEEYR